MALDMSRAVHISDFSEIPNRTESTLAPIRRIPLKRIRQTARRTVAQSHLRQIGMGLHMYAADNNNAMPESAADWQSRLAPTYVPSDSIFQIPGRDSNAHAAFVYLPGYAINTIVNPTRTIIVYESNPNPWQGRVLLLYADGHVEDVRADQLDSLLTANEKPGAAPPAPPAPTPPDRPVP